MAMRSVLSRVSVSVTRRMESTRGATRCFSDDKGRVLGEEERAAENVYIKKFFPSTNQSDSSPTYLANLSLDDEKNLEK
ncbi:hypothetical protein FH972_010331 [Carpinus fangiana]|uniref:Uncharacterized protein n=1 Tax=Carpinus fangiana TaxID=176857 RepID=A0A660KQR8_9ROSI|nr:hypothetical protein FH972_010331 [Carpinus fangiana]